MFQYFINGNDTELVSMDFDGVRTFTYQFPYLSEGDSVEFYFTYSDSLGNAYRIPEEGNYKFIYGQLDIYLNSKLRRVSSDYIISEVYPNPFIPAQHSFTTLAVKSSGSERLRITIIDASGQQVKLYETVTTKGENYFSWNGVTDRGIQCASGVYFYLISLGTKNYGRKMVLMK